MGNTVYKTYELEEVLSLFINRNGISELLSTQDSELKEGINDNEFEVVIKLPSNEEGIDIQIERDFFDDADVPENETEEARNNRVTRYQKIVIMLKQKYNYKCQLCGYSFRMDNGNNYCEAHHIKMLSKDGSQSPENVIILCANHHRIFHYASDTSIIGEFIDGRRIIKIGKEKFTVQF